MLGFIQLITKATRIQGASRTLIDLILTNSNRDTYKAGTLICDISDHFLNFIELPITPKLSKTKPVHKRNLSNENIDRFKTSLKDIRWNDVLASNDTKKFEL